jgi:hypothetical protein
MGLFESSFYVYPGNTNLAGRLRAVDLLKKVNDVFNIKSGSSKLVGTRRSPIPSLPAQLVFPGLNITEREGSVQLTSSLGCFDL